jgi:hypothetical protein
MCFAIVASVGTGYDLGDSHLGDEKEHHCGYYEAPIHADDFTSVTKF